MAEDLPEDAVVKPLTVRVREEPQPVEKEPGESCGKMARLGMSGGP
jgi:hypothetical protein